MPEDYPRWAAASVMEALSFRRIVYVAGARVRTRRGRVPTRLVGAFPRNARARTLEAADCAAMCPCARVSGRVGEKRREALRIEGLGRARHFGPFHKGPQPDGKNA